VAETTWNVLFLCTGNSARSILAEAVLNADSGGRLRGYSAGSHPRGEVHPLALELLRGREVPTRGLRSKGWDEFAAPGAPEMDFIITVCDAAAGETCPIWPGHPVTAHWGMPDPAAPASEAAQRAVFRAVLKTLERRIAMLAAADLRGADRARLHQMMIAIRDLVPYAEAEGEALGAGRLVSVGTIAL
jgi:arsenate reductase